MSQWIQDFTELLASRLPVQEENARRVLRQARSLKPSPRLPWTSVGYVWLNALFRFTTVQAQGREERAEESLRWLLQAGLPPTGAVFSTRGLEGQDAQMAIKKYHGVVRADIHKNSEKKALYAGIPFRNNHIASLTTSFLGRSFWAGRYHPRLPEVVRAWLDGGADPNWTAATVEKTWSSWPIALISGRVDALSVMAAHTSERPVDWVRAVTVALGHACSGAMNTEDAAKVVKAVEWFAQAYPPSLEERQQVWDKLLAPSEQRSGHSLSSAVAWLWVERNQLAHGGDIPGAPVGFNPWSVVVNPEQGLEHTALEVCQLLEAHPRWGRPEALREAREAGTGDAARPVLDAFLLSWPREAVHPWRDHFLDLVTRWRIAPDERFPEWLAGNQMAPDAAATKWLKKNQNLWNGDAAKSSPWHWGSEWDGVPNWLIQNRIRGDQIDARGDMGWGTALATAIGRNQTVLMPDLVKLMAEQKLSGDELGLGLPISAWVASVDRIKLPLTGGPAAPVKTAQAILVSMDVKAAENLFQAPGWKLSSLPAADQALLLREWSMATSPRSDKQAFMDSFTHLDVDKKAASIFRLMCKGQKATDLSVALGGWIESVAQRDMHSLDSREFSGSNHRLLGRDDLKAAFEFLEGHDPYSLSNKDQWILGKWFLASMVNQLDVFKDKSFDVHPWGTYAWENMQCLDRARLARAMIHWLRRESLEAPPYSVSASQTNFPNKLIAAISSIVLDGGKVSLTEGLSLEQIRALTKALDRLPAAFVGPVSFWRSCTSAELLENDLPAPAVTLPRPRF